VNFNLRTPLLSPFCHVALDHYLNDTYAQFMYIFSYLRASTKEQDAKRAQDSLKSFAEDKGARIAGWYIENVDRLSRLNDEDWETLKALINKKQLKVISLDLPTSHAVLMKHQNDDFTSAMFRAINNMMLDMLAAIARKDYQDRRRRQVQGIERAKEEGFYRGRRPDLDMHEKIIQLRVHNQLSVNATAKLVGVSAKTVIRIVKYHNEHIV
jgi:DNA invertase Pin-like site-specific DNA recombinase